MIAGRFKSMLKSALTDDQMAQVLAWRSRMPALFSKALARLPIDQVVGIKEDLQPEGILDYGPKQLRLQLTSRMERSRLHACEKEPETVAWLERTLRAGDVLFDVGANVGAYSLVAAAILEGAGQVFSFEPSFSTFAALSHNVQLNDMTGKVFPFQVALTDQTGFVEFEYRNLSPGAADHAVQGDPTEGRFVPTHQQSTLGYRLDDFIATFNLPAPTVMKIDVDGGEERVVHGAERVLGTPGLRTVLIEIDSKVGPPERIVDLLEPRGLLLSARYQRGQTTVANYIFERAS